MNYLADGCTQTMLDEYLADDCEMDASFDEHGRCCDCGSPANEECQEGCECGFCQLRWRLIEDTRRRA
jgi:hypothetical protein